MALGAGAIINPIKVPQETLILAIVALFVISLLSLLPVLTKIAVEKVGVALIFTFTIFILLLVSTELAL